MRRVTPRRLGLGAALLLALGAACVSSPDPARVGSDDPTDGGAQAPQNTSGDVPPEPDAAPVNGSITDPFAADVEYAATITAASATDAHQVADAAAPAAKPDCLSCHGDGSLGATTKFVAGGITFTTPGANNDGGAPCAACEVLFVDSTGHRIKAITAPDGTFALRADEYGAVSAKTHVGIRKGNLSNLMPLSETVDKDGVLRSCNSASCHRPGTGPENPIVLGAQ